MKKTIILTLSLLTVLSSTGFASQVEKAAALDVADQEQIATAQTAANYILNNLHLINEKREAAGFHNAVYSATVSDILIDAYYEPDYLEGKLLDFDDNKGYMVVGPNNRYYTLALQGNPPYNSFTSGVKVYEVNQGFCYLNDQNELVVLGDPAIDRPNDTEQPEDGQDMVCECRITDPDAYINSRYGPDGVTYVKGYSIRRNLAHSMIGFSEDNIALYKKENADGTVTYPDMMGYSAAYSIFDYLSRAIPKSEWTNHLSNYYLQVNGEPDLYNERVNEGYTTIVRKLTQAQRDFRRYVLDNYGSDAGLTSLNIRQMIPALFADKNVKVSKGTLWRAFMITKSEYFEKSYPMLFDARNTIAYGNHLFAACGYKRYDKDEGIVGILGKITVIFMLEVKDGIVDNFGESTYFDFNRFINKVGYIYYFSFPTN